MNHKVDHNKTYLKQEPPPPPTTASPPSPPPPSTASPPSAASSPTHEFTFIHHHNPITYNTNNTYKTNTNTNTTTTLQPPSPTPPPAVIDLSPADDIFFKGQLLPLHPHFNLNNLPDSPRSSTNSMDSFTLPINLLLHHSNPIGNTSFHCHHQTTFSNSDEPVTATNPKPSKSKSFSIFGIPKWTKRPDDEIEIDLDHTKEINSKKVKLDHLGQLIKRYMKMVRPLLSFPKSRRLNAKYNHQSYSFSTNSLSRKPQEMSRGGKRRGQFSAPASMRASPGNSGVLIASGYVSPTKSTSESSMEELHAAIQAAIAHCKNSIAVEDKIQSQK